MYKRKKLPFIYPSITGYQGIASLFAILENYSETQDWIYSNYIQTYGYIRNGNFELTIYPGFETMRFCPWINFSLLNRDLIINLKEDICNFLMDCILSDNYIYVMLEQSGFSAGDRQRESPFPHNTFVYGFDFQKKVFYITDFTFHGEYSFEEVTFKRNIRSRIFKYDSDLHTS